MLESRVTNQFLRVPPAPPIRAIQVPAGFDAADGPSASSPRDSKTSAGELDRWLARHAPQPGPAASE